MRYLITSAMSSFVFTALLLLLLLNPAPAPEEPEAPTAMEIAEEYARQHGMTSCAVPAQAELDDVILALPNGSDGLPHLDPANVRELGFDEALGSAEFNWTNIIACEGAQEEDR